MLEIDFNDELGWSAPMIKPLQNLSLHPGASSLQYGLQCFEGMKAYKCKNGYLRLFRPMKNMERLATSMECVSLPALEGHEFLKCIEEFIRVESRWVPDKANTSLYLRPTAISTEETLGVSTPRNCKLYVVASQVGSYFPDGFSAVSLFADDAYVRAWPGGTGRYKIGGNYAATIRPQRHAQKAGYAQVLWLFNDEITEVGTMNLMCLWEDKNGEKELVTAPLDGTILPGVTRDAVLHLARELGEFKVSERTFTMSEFQEASRENRVIEMFGCGTACVVCPIKLIHYNGEDYHIPIDSAGAGKFTQRMFDTILGIQTGEIEHEFSHIIQP